MDTINNPRTIIGNSDTGSSSFMRTPDFAGLEVSEIEDLLNEAKALMNAGRFSASTQLLCVHLKQHPNDTLAFKLALTLYFRLKDNEQLCQLIEAHARNFLTNTWLPIVKQAASQSPHNRQLQKLLRQYPH